MADIYTPAFSTTNLDFNYSTGSAGMIVSGAETVNVRATLLETTTQLSSMTAGSSVFGSPLKLVPGAAGSSNTTRVDIIENSTWTTVSLLYGFWCFDPVSNPIAPFNRFSGIVPGCSLAVITQGVSNLEFLMPVSETVVAGDLLQFDLSTRSFKKKQTNASNQYPAQLFMALQSSGTISSGKVLIKVSFYN